MTMTIIKALLTCFLLGIGSALLITPIVFSFAFGWELADWTINLIIRAAL